MHRIVRKWSLPSGSWLFSWMSKQLALKENKRLLTMRDKKIAIKGDTYIVRECPNNTGRSIFIGEKWVNTNTLVYSPQKKPKCPCKYVGILDCTGVVSLDSISKLPRDQTPPCCWQDLVSEHLWECKGRRSTINVWFMISRKKSIVLICKISFYSKVTFKIKCLISKHFYFGFKFE